MIADCSDDNGVRIQLSVSRALTKALDRINRVRALCYVDLNDDYRRSILISSSGRSGSTWLADMVNYRNEYRLVFEPFRRDLSKIAAGIPYGLYLQPGRESDAEARVVEAILRGRVRNTWSNWHNRRRIARRRIIKEIRATNLMPWIRERFPGLPIVYLLRHPVSVAQSWTRLGWPDFLDEFTRQELLMDRLAPFRPVIDDVVRAGNPFERHLLRWCLENVIPLRDLSPGDAHVVFYEHLVADPEQELRELFGYLGKEFEPAVLERVDAASPLTYPGAPAQALGEEALTRACEIVSAFGLDRLYGRGAEPRVGPGSVGELLSRR
jgi:hypothetical protein